MAFTNFHTPPGMTFNSGYWMLTQEPKKMVWSENFYSNLGYIQKELKPTLNFFKKKLLHAQDISKFEKNFLNFKTNGLHFEQDINVASKEGGYKTYKCVSHTEHPNDNESLTNYIYFLDATLKTHQNISDDSFYYKETAKMTATGKWHVDFLEKKTFWDDETKRILEYNTDYIPSIKDGWKYYAEDHKKLAANLFNECAKNGHPFNTKIKMITASGRLFWARAKGEPVYDQTKNIIGVRGIFQDIDEVVMKEHKLQKSVNIIASQNSRLFNFAHIVSHNLRSHTSNLSLLVQLAEDIDNPNEKIGLMDELKQISSQLNNTIEHLNEIVSIQTNKDQIREDVYFNDAYKLVTRGILKTITSSKTNIEVDFSELESIEYIPAYLESILLNLITNAIKYRHPNRLPLIRIKSYIKNKKNYLQITDNGVGIDMVLFKEKLFGMYETFHYNKDAIGLGLFITKNHVESLGGTIRAESVVNKGTTFIIEF